MRILVTGGSGFIGTNYIELQLRIGNAEFINLDNRPPRNPAHKSFWQGCDILDASRIETKIRDFSPTHVVHLAAKCGLDETELDAYAANMEGAENLLFALKEMPSVERVIFTSSLLVCRVDHVPKHDADYQPSTLYGRSKARMEEIIRAEKTLPFVWTIVRPISIWGPWCEGSYREFFKTIAQGRYFHIGHGHYRKSLGYVENTVHQIHKLLLAPVEKVDRKTIYLADEPPADLYDFANKVQSVLGVKRLRHIPLGMTKLAAKVGDIFKATGWHSVPITSFRLNNILTEYVFDLQPIMEISAPLPYDFQTAVERTVGWMRSKCEI
jgi:nucleoside-diphosphate-sugar epimerase